MGNHSKLDRFSTNVSTQTEPGAGLKATGFTAGTQPVAKNMNWLVSETIDKVNDVLEDGTISGFDDSVGMAPIIQKYIPAGDDAGWAQAYDGPNVIEHGATLGWVALCAHVTTAGVREVLALDGNATNPTCQVTRFDAATGALNGVSGDLSTGNLPAVGTEVWAATDMCSDGTSVYITFEDTDAAPVTHQIQAFDIATWTRKSGWPNTGTALPGTGARSGYQNNGVMVVSATQIATANSWWTTTFAGDATDTAITLIGMADGVIDANGAGDAPVGGTPFTLASDGAYIYFLCSTTKDVCSASIASDLIGGTGNTNWPYTATANQNQGIVHTGTLIATGWDNSSNANVLRIHTQDDGHVSTSAYADDRVIEDIGSMTWDGLCVWARCTVDLTGTEKTAIARIDINQASYQVAGTVHEMPTLEQILKTVMILDMDAAHHVAQETSPIMFDGRDIWVVGNKQISQTLSGNIYRITKAVLR